MFIFLCLQHRQTYYREMWQSIMLWIKHKIMLCENATRKSLSCHQDTKFKEPVLHWETRHVQICPEVISVSPDSQSGQSRLKQHSLIPQLPQTSLCALSLLLACYTFFLSSSFFGYGNISSVCPYTTFQRYVFLVLIKQVHSWSKTPFRMICILNAPPPPPGQSREELRHSGTLGCNDRVLLMRRR